MSDEVHAEGCKRRDNQDATCSCGGVRLPSEYVLLTYERARALWDSETIDRFLAAKILMQVEGYAGLLYSPPTDFRA